jgi:hypothetical protein
LHIRGSVRLFLELLAHRAWIRRRRHRSQRKERLRYAFSVRRRRAIPDARSPFFGAARASRLESAVVVIARRGKNASAHAFSVRGARFPTLAAQGPPVVVGVVCWIAKTRLRSVVSSQLLGEQSWLAS